ncbi:unnamed protein product [Dicrocoelium dendriticum]|nr:unnamed protein product [Dicrocoelium dendriticum]
MLDATCKSSLFKSARRNYHNHESLSAPVTLPPGMAVNSTTENDATANTTPSTTKRIRLLRPLYNTTTITITCKQHLTIKQYKPAETSDTYSITCLPLSVFEFWSLQFDQQHAEPFATLRNAFPMCHCDHATVRLSHYIPLQKSRQRSTATDVTAFNSAPYMYTAEDNSGLLNTVHTNVTEAALLNQDCKVPSNTYWQFSYDQGLLARNNVQTLSANEVYFKRYYFDSHFRFHIRTQQPVSNRYRFMPGDYYRNTSPYPYTPFWKQNGPSQTVPTEPLTDFTSSYAFGIYNHTTNPIFLFLPHIEPVSTSEDIVRMMGHVLLETQFTLTLIGPQDGYRNIASTLNVWTAANSVELGSGLYTSTVLRFPTLLH